MRHLTSHGGPPKSSVIEFDHGSRRAPDDALEGATESGIGNVPRVRLFSGNGYAAVTGSRSSSVRPASVAAWLIPAITSWAIPAVSSLSSLADRNNHEYDSETMGYDVAVYGHLSLPKKAMTPWRGGTAEPGAHDDWGHLGGNDPSPHPIASVLERMGALADLTQGDGKVTVEGLLSKDPYIDHARVWAAAFRAAAPLGGQGRLTFVAIEGARFGYRVEITPEGSHVEALDDADLSAADKSPEVARIKVKLDALLMEALADDPDLAEMMGITLPAKKKPRPKKKATGKNKSAAKKGTRSKAELLELARDGKSADRRKALAELVRTDPAAAEALALEWLEGLSFGGSWAKDCSRTVAGLEVLPEIASDTTVATLCRELLKWGSTGIDVAIADTLAECRNPNTAEVIAANITREAFAEHVGQACDLLEVLARRGEVGDEAKLRSIVADPADWLSAAKPWFDAEGADGGYQQWLELLPDHARKTLEAANLPA